MRFLPQKNAKMTVFCTLNTKKCAFLPKKHIKNWQKLRKSPCFCAMLTRPKKG